MYIPSSYQNTNLDEVKEFIHQNPFGILINQTDGKLWGTHIPFLLIEDEGSAFLRGHISKANLQCKSLSTDEEVLVIFQGPHAYISSSWYKEEEVPTWNYIAVHTYGKIRIQTMLELEDSLRRLINKHELETRSSLTYDHFSAKTLSQINGILGFEIEITEIQAAYKLSQTREEDHPRISKELSSKNKEILIRKNTNSH